MVLRPKTPPLKQLSLASPATRTQAKDNHTPLHLTVPKPTDERLNRRKRRSEVERSDETSDSETVNDRSPSLRKRQRTTSTLPPPSERVNFDFHLVTSYDASGVAGGFTSQEMRADLEDLWKAISKVEDFWQEQKGTEWQDVFKFDSYSRMSKPCITTRFTSGRRNSWREGCEGKYACRGCVARGQPCFTFTLTEGEGEIWLLPLHKEDRKLEVEKGFEIRYWINEEGGETSEDEEME